jgi:formate dehydrogenase subunit gamma
MAEVMIKRLSMYGRVLHLGTAVSFLYAFFTGIGLAFPKMNWLLAVLGGGETARWFHPWAGVVFSAFGVLMLFAHLKDVLITKDDITWLCGIHHYACNREEKLPETHMYNAGQKLYFWITVFCGSIVFFLSGWPMWYPTDYAVDTVRLAIVAHELMFIVGGAFCIVHAYMGSIGMPGSLSTLITGKVTEEWGRVHHPKWYREVTGKSK